MKVLNVVLLQAIIVSVCQTCPDGAATEINITNWFKGVLFTQQLDQCNIKFSQVL